MNKVQKAYYEMKKIDELADGDSPVHLFSPLSKFLVTIIYILILTSIDKYALDKTISFLIYPLVMYPLAQISLTGSLHRMRHLLPFLVLIGLFNPLLDKGIALHIGRIAISYGMLSFLTFLVKGVLILLATYLLVATTRINDLCGALRKLHVPSLLVSLFLMTYRYIFAMVQELATMSEAYQLRAPGQKGIHYKAWGSFLGQLLLRSSDQASEIYSAMKLRGYDGEYYIENEEAGSSIPYLVIWILVFVVFRFFDIAQWIGRIFI